MIRNIIITIISICIISTGHIYAYNTKSLKKIVNNEELTGGHENITDWSHKIADREGYGRYLNKAYLKDGTTSQDESQVTNALHHF